MTSKKEIEYGPIKPGEEKPVIDMVRRSFDKAVAPAYSEKGIREFRKYASLKEIAFRTRANHFILVARRNGKPVGMIEIRDNRHVSMFFVEADFQNMGIGRQLMAHAFDICRKKRPDLGAITVNASPNAIPAYRRLGFFEDDAEKTTNGIRYTPMKRPLSDETDVDR